LQFVDPAHRLEVVFADRTRFVVQAAPADPKRVGLTREVRLAIATRYFFAFGNRPALSSAPS